MRNEKLVNDETQGILNVVTQEMNGKWEGKGILIIQITDKYNEFFSPVFLFNKRLTAV